MTEMPDWIDKNPEEIESLVKELADKGNPPSKIGIILRDQYGIPEIKEATGKKITEILDPEDTKTEIPEDLLNLMKKAVRLRNHIDKNPKDHESKRSLNKLEANINKLVKYYKKNEKLPSDWRYDPEEAELLVRG